MTELLQGLEALFPSGLEAWLPSGLEASLPDGAAGVVRLAAMGALLLVLAWLSVIDLRIRRLPDRIVLPGLWAGLVLNASGVFTSASDAVLGAACGYGALWLLSLPWRLRGVAAFGGGDLKLAAMIGAWVGASLLPAALLVAFVGGSLAVLPLLLLCRASLAQRVPFGPALAAGGAAAMLAGPALPALLFGA